MYAIIRAEKTKKSGIAGKNSHNLRLRETKNADPERKKLNQILVGTGDLKVDLKNKISETDAVIRNKETVLCTELLLTASPEFFEKNTPQQNSNWIDTQIDFLKKEFGENCINAVLHLDETTPHIHAFITPIVKNEKTNKLEFNNKAYFGLNGYKPLQDKYFEYNKTLGLNRGLEKNKTESSHKDIKEFYGDINTTKKELAKYDKTVKIEEFKPEVKKGFFRSTEKSIQASDVNEHTNRAVKRFRKRYKSLKAGYEKKQKEVSELKAKISNIEKNHLSGFEKEIEHRFEEKISRLEDRNSELKRQVKAKDMLIQQNQSALKSKNDHIDDLKKTNELYVNTTQLMIKHNSEAFKELYADSKKKQDELDKAAEKAAQEELQAKSHSNANKLTFKPK